MNASRTTTAKENTAAANDDNRPAFRTKTISTRLTTDELAYVESAAEQAGKPLSEWLREMALTAAKGQPSDPIELLLSEVWALRFALLNLFHAGAQATAEGCPLLPESVLKISDRADAKKLEQAHKMLTDFLGQRAKEDAKD